MSALTDRLQVKRDRLRHYTEVLREAREAMEVLDVAKSANGLCRDLREDYAGTMDRIDEGRKP